MLNWVSHTIPNDNNSLLEIKKVSVINKLMRHCENNLSLILESIETNIPENKDENISSQMVAIFLRKFQKNIRRL